MSATATKELGAEITKLENRLEDLTAEVGSKQKSLDSLNELIERKTNDYNLYLAQKDADTKKAYSDVLAAQERLAKDKEEFQEILKTHKQMVSDFEISRKEFEIKKLRHDAQVNNVQQFISSVRRATGLLGF